ncbi:hypothetical protein [Pedobacter terrae]|uniref:hypothetical protein n=1 Tax=Pedobacter terrae TaxID=405671 RepID=UPI002FFBE674
MSSILANLLSLISIIPPFIVFGACCFLLIKKSSAEAMLMAMGSGISLIINILYTFVPSLLAAQNLKLTEITKYYSIGGIIGFMDGICFAAGFLILVINTVKKNKAISDQFAKSTDYNHE